MKGAIEMLATNAIKDQECLKKNSLETTTG